ncbi:hypothetical protein C8E95_7198 [Pseudonocardia autotrophica]|nr:hypothetical protein C8E95_7198 [Pseudonocardia autotrophica]
MLAHDPADPLVVHPLRRLDAVVDFGGDPRPPAGAVSVVHGADPLGQGGVRGSALRAGGRGGEPGGRTRNVARRVVRTAASPSSPGGGWRSCRSGRRRTGSGSPVRRPRRNTWPPGEGSPARSRVWSSPPAVPCSRLRGGPDAARASHPRRARHRRSGVAHAPNVRCGCGCRRGRCGSRSRGCPATTPAWPARRPGRRRCPSPSPRAWTRTARRPADGTRRSSSCGPWSDIISLPRPCGDQRVHGTGSGPVPGHRTHDPDTWNGPSTTAGNHLPRSARAGAGHPSGPHRSRARSGTKEG